jgi:hypothetical protein
MSLENESLQGGLDTQDTFIRAVPWGDSRMVLVHRRVHGWREYVRFRTWNRHRQLSMWYPSRRFFIVPLENAMNLAIAVAEAVNGIVSPKPDWLMAREQAEEEQLGRMATCGASEEVVERAKQELERERRQRV